MIGLLAQAFTGKLRFSQLYNWLGFCDFCIEWVPQWQGFTEHLRYQVGYLKIGKLVYN